MGEESKRGRREDKWRRRRKRNLERIVATTNTV
jgi:hypothetical protein